MRAWLVAIVLAVLIVGIARALPSLRSDQAQASGTTAVAVSASDDHTCALTNAGGVKCWGYNYYGELGDGTTSMRSTPVDVVGLTSGVTAVSARDGNTCALTSAGGVKCWGRNDFGQIGDGGACGIVVCTTPVDVTGLASGVTAVSLGGAPCALTTVGGVKCWGNNQVGVGAVGDGGACGIVCTTPVDVSGLTSGVVAVSGGQLSTCAITTEGAVKCWGQTFGSVPGDVQGLDSGINSAGTGFLYLCALTAEGGIKCRGWNSQGQLGDGTTTDSYLPVDVSGLSSGASAVSVGYNSNCALTTVGGLKCWGNNNIGQLGDGTSGNISSVPVDVIGLTSGVESVSNGYYHTCAVTSDGGIKCWGWNAQGQLGGGPPEGSSVPVDVIGFGPKPTPTPTDTPTATPCPDFDGDSSCDGDDADDDDDGCPDVRELATGPGAQNSGGNRDPLNGNDYFNPTHDGKNRIDDILAVLQQYFIDQGNPNYTTATDRTRVGPNAWNLGPPNGLQRIDDILNIVHQYYHDCAL